MKPLAPAVLLAFVLASSSAALSDESKKAAAGGVAGLVELDLYTFDKVTKAFKFALVKLSGPRQGVADWAKEDAFYDFVAEFRNASDDLLMAEVNVKVNRKLGRRFDVDDERVWPEIVFLANTAVEEDGGGGGQKSKKKVTTTETRYGKGASVDEIRSFVKAKSKLALTRSGCLPKFDVLAEVFVTHAGDLPTQTGVLESTRELAAKCCTRSAGKQASADRYAKLMSGALKESFIGGSGDSAAAANAQSAYFVRELKRLEKLLREEGEKPEEAQHGGSGGARRKNLSDGQRKEMVKFVNIAKSFLKPNAASKGLKDEL